MKHVFLSVSGVATALFLSACQTLPQAPAEPQAHKARTTAPSFRPAQKLAGRWHNNQEGATKQFTPKSGDDRRGNADGFWPEGAVYRVTSVNAAERSLKLEVETKEPSEENEHHQFSAEVTFTPDAKHMTMTRHLPNHLPDETVTYYRTR